MAKKLVGYDNDVWATARSSLDAALGETMQDELADQSLWEGMTDDERYKQFTGSQIED